MFFAGERLRASGWDSFRRRFKAFSTRLASFAVVVICGTRLAGRLWAGPAVDEVLEKLKPVPACAALVATAAEHAIPLAGIDAPEGEDLVNPGDTVTALVTLHEKGDRLTQWLIHLQAVKPGAKDTPPKSSGPMVIYDSLGTQLEFASSPVLVALRTFGPFAASETKRKPREPSIRDARFYLDKGFLGLGLDRTAVATCRLAQAKAKTGGSFFCGTGKPGAEQVKAARKLNDVWKLTSEEERALTGSCPALLSYFAIVQQTQGLSDILWEIVDIPSTWSLLRHGGVNANFQVGLERLGIMDTPGWGLTEGKPVYRYPLLVQLNDRPALDLTFIVTTPRPPLLACGGIVGLLAEKPGNADIYMTLRVVSARRAAK